MFEVDQLDGTPYLAMEYVRGATLSRVLQKLRAMQLTMELGHVAYLFAGVCASPDAATPELRAACQLTEQQCTRCHPIGKLFAIDVQTREEWEPIVDRMRRIASSTITMEDAQVVRRCLEQRRR